MPGLSKTLKRGLVVLGGCMLLAGASVGVINAQTASSTPVSSPGSTAQQHHQAVLTQAAHILGIPESQLQQALQQARKDVGGGALHQFRLAKVVRAELSVAANSLGETSQQLRQELKGNTLTAVANAHNVAPSTVSAAITGDVNAKIDAAVAAGKLNANQAAKLKAKVPNEVSTLMTRNWGKGSAKPGASNT